MKKGIGLSIALACIFFAGAAKAEKIGFINDPELAQKSTALQGLQMQRDKILAVLKVDLEKELKEIFDKKQKLEEESAKLSKAEVGKRLDAIDKAEKDLQARAQAAAAELQKNFVEAAVSFKEKAINPVIKDLAEENDFDAILNSANAFYVDEKLNVTEIAYGKKLKSAIKDRIQLYEAKKAEYLKKVTLEKAKSK